MVQHNQQPKFWALEEGGKVFSTSSSDTYKTLSMNLRQLQLCQLQL